MKKLRILLAMMALVAGAAFVASCSSDDDPVTAELTATPGTLSFDYNETAAKTITVKGNVAWTAVSSEDWCTIDKTSGTNDDTISVTVSEWDGTANRTATITVTGGDIERKVTVTQKFEVIPTVPAKATITGDNSGEGSVLLTASATGAETYVWYNGTTKITDATAATYTATESGTYYAAGVNAIGEGEQSEGKTVTVTPRTPTDIEGTYNVAAYSFWGEKNESWTTTISHLQSSNGVDIYTMDRLPWDSGDGTAYHQMFIQAEEYEGEIVYYFTSYDGVNALTQVTSGGTTYDVYQTIGGYESREDEGAYMLTGVVQITINADGSLTLPEKLTVEFQGGEVVEMFAAIGSYVIMGQNDLWLTCIGEFTQFSNSTRAFGGPSISIEKGKVQKTPVLKAVGNTPAGMLKL